MSLRKLPKSTPQGSAASRESSKKSHGPVSAQGKANVGLNALQDGSYCSASARTFGDTLMALGEAPEEFERLCQELLAPYEPAHPLGPTISSNFKFKEQT